jgi:farnesyl diphosphate synthase
MRENKWSIGAMSDCNADWAHYRVGQANRVEARLEAALVEPDALEGRLWRAMRYAVLGGGKRLRGFLALESAALFDEDASAALDIAAAIECAHAYSLVHDDLPAMDNDDLRRGKPTCHLAFDEATAILVGDALQSLSFSLILSSPIAAAPKIALANGLAQAIGPNGMVGGQIIDLLAEGRIDMSEGPAKLDQAQTERLQLLKTGALIRFSATTGAVLASADPTPLVTYAECIGLAFQIQDDLIDVEGDESAAGKRLRKDAIAGKSTFVDFLGVEGARRLAHNLIDEAKTALSPYGDKAAHLRQAAEFVIERAT